MTGKTDFWKLPSRRNNKELPAKKGHFHESPRQHLTDDGKLVFISMDFYQIILSSYLIKFWIFVCCYNIEIVLEKNDIHEY